MFRRSLHVAPFVVMLGVAACSGRDAPPADASRADVSRTADAAPNVLTITATEYAFEAPATVPAGITTIRLVTHGVELHQAVLIRLDDGKTVDDLAAALKRPGPLPTWAHAVGGPNPPAPKGQTETVVELEPGNYAVICVIPSADRVPHFAKGMIQPLTVTPAPATGSLPDADVVLKLNDYAFALTQPLQVGRQTIRVENDGPQLHEVALARLLPGKTMQDLVAWEAGGAKGAPPVEFLGGAAPMAAGQRATFDADLVAGDYLIICFVPDAKDGRPHLMHGMMQQFRVGAPDRGA